MSVASALALAAVSLSLGSIRFLPVLIVWSAASWITSPMMQGFLLHNDPASSSAGVALNTSVMHLGVSFGAALSDLVVTTLGITATPQVGFALMLAALTYALGANTLGGATQALPFNPLTW